MGSSYIELAPWHLVPPITAHAVIAIASVFFISQPTGTSLPLAESISALAAVVDPGTELLYFEWPHPDIVSDIPSEDVWSIWYIFWYATWHCGIYSDVLSDILSGILSGIYSGILHIWHLFCHSLWHTLELAIWRSPGTLHSIWSWWYASECSKCSKRGGGIGGRGQDEGGRGCGRRRRGGGGRVAPLLKSRDPHLPGGEKETWKIHGFKAKW